MNIILNVKKWLTRFVFNASDTWKNVIQSPQANFDFNWIQDKVERTKWNMLSLRDILRVFWSRLGCLIQIKFNLTTWRRTEQKSEIRLQTVDTVNYIDKNGGDNFPGGSSNNLPMFTWLHGLSKTTKTFSNRLTGHKSFRIHVFCDWHGGYGICV